MRACAGDGRRGRGVRGPGHEVTLEAVGGAVKRAARWLWRRRDERPEPARWTGRAVGATTAPMATFELTLNGEARELPGPTTLADALDAWGYTHRGFAYFARLEPPHNPVGFFLVLCWPPAWQDCISVVKHLTIKVNG